MYCEIEAICYTTTTMFNNQSVLFKTGPGPEISELLAFQNQSPDFSSTSEPEGQLAVDVVETPNEIIVVVAMAGTKPEDIELHLANDVFTIRGKRSAPVPPNSTFFYHECFWGRFSRTIVLPTNVKSEHTQAVYRNGVLTVTLPKARAENGIPIMVIEE